MSELVNLSDATVVKGTGGFCVALRDGSMPVAGDHPFGYYREDCRHLSAHVLRIAGEPLRMLVSADVAGSAAVFELTNPELELPGGEPLEAQRLRARVERRIVAGGMIERIFLQSYVQDEVRFDLELCADADFRPMLEIRELVEPHERDVRREARDDALAFAATGLDGRTRWTRFSARGAHTELTDRLTVAILLRPGEPFAVEVHCDAGEGRPPARRTLGCAAVDGGRGGGTLMRPAAADAERWLAERPRVEVDDEIVDRVLRRSLLDLHMLSSELFGRRYYAAGVPWYATLFGRDSIIAALQMLTFEPETAGETLRLLASVLGTRFDDEHDEEPGKVIHELRSGEIANVGLTPLTRYYGTVDATPLFLCLLCEQADWTGSLELFRELRPQIELALRWLDEHGDLDGDGLLEYHCRSSRGLANQGWKDSHDAIVDEHGELLTGPIALVEVQGYAMRAKRRLARLFELEGDDERALELRSGAARMAAGIERFWLEDRGWYALALDGDKRPSRTLASNQGHLLWSLAVPTERAAQLRDALMGDGAYSGWGVRTLAGGERAFNPIGYHTGTVWPHDNALFAVGLRKYGFNDAFLRVFDGLMDAAASFHGHRLPELFAGYTRRPYEAPVPYPVACSPQAWAAGALPSALTAGLGLVADGLGRKLRIRRPSLPRDVSRLALRGLRVGAASADLLFERVANGGVALTAADVDGPLDIVLEIAPGCDQELAPTLAQVRATAAERA